MFQSIILCTNYNIPRIERHLAMLKKLDVNLSVNGKFY